MFWSLVSLLVVLLVVRGIVWLARSFFAWLGRGKPIERASKGENVPPDVQEAALALKVYHQEKKLAKELGHEIDVPSRLSHSQLREVRRAERLVRAYFIDNLHLGWYQIVILFIIGSVGGLVLEEIWMFITAGLTQSRVGLVWGPFSPLYGVGTVLLTIISLQLRKKHAKWWQVFLVAMVVGGLLEQVTGWSMETFMGAVSWDYSHVWGHITKWVALPFLGFWGILGLIWCNIVTPWLLTQIGEPTTKRQVTFVFILAVYLAADISMTLMCFQRRAARDAGIAPRNAFEQWVDERYSNEFMSNRFQNMVITAAGGDSQV
ncbi:MAG: putative ABC transporter permease [Atopobiaceae bacterium]|jgi:uncharacterized membrane protein